MSHQQNTGLGNGSNRRPGVIRTGVLGGPQRQAFGPGGPGLRAGWPFRGVSARKIGAPLVAILFVGLLGMGTARAHQKTAPQQPRELLYLQGYLAEPSAGVPIVRTIELSILAREYRFYATDWRRFGFQDKDEPPPVEELLRATLHGDRPSLHRIASARPDQRVTILVERRVGSSDLFLLTLDLCPSD